MNDESPSWLSEPIPAELMNHPLVFELRATIDCQREALKTANENLREALRALDASNEVLRRFNHRLDQLSERIPS